MRNFLQSSGAIAIGLIVGAMFTFPLIAAGAVIGWLFIAEELDK